jgi:hypothetical protein
MDKAQRNAIYTLFTDLRASGMSPSLAYRRILAAFGINPAILGSVPGKGEIDGADGESTRLELIGFGDVTLADVIAAEMA